jgi:hypothetical protein
MSIFSPFWILWRLFRASPSLQVAISAAVAGRRPRFERGCAGDGLGPARNSAASKA